MVYMVHAQHTTPPPPPQRPPSFFNRKACKKKTRCHEKVEQKTSKRSGVLLWLTRHRGPDRTRELELEKHSAKDSVKGFPQSFQRGGKCSPQTACLCERHNSIVKCKNRCVFVFLDDDDNDGGQTITVV